MFRISDTIRQTQTMDGGVLLDVRHGQMFCLNLVGAKIIQLMQRGYDESRIADEISRDYGASREVVRCRSPNRCLPTLRGFLPVWRKLFGLGLLADSLTGKRCT
jgi:hypothetical protein